MANHYFKFKQFVIQQDRCAMKVSTDACLLGAWTPIAAGVKNVLDIGAGTGLLSLMLAQRSTRIEIDAIELDEAASRQARENVQASPWNHRIEVIHGDVRTYAFSHSYDLVICNPPFFSQGMLGQTSSRNQARHTIALSHPELLSAIDRVLAPDGYASILLPALEHQAWESLLSGCGWHVLHRLHIHHQADSPANRMISLCSRSATEQCETQVLTIFIGPRHYSLETTELLKPFYLKL